MSINWNETNVYGGIGRPDLKPSGTKIILDLCGGTGAWSKPYKDNGYTVMNLTLPDYDVRSYLINDYGDIVFDGKSGAVNWIIPVDEIYGVFAAPPCTMFSFARTNAKLPRDLNDGMSIVEACLKIIWECLYDLEKDTQKKSPLKFWVLENPNRGMLKWFLGKPAFVFNPYDFGDNYKKETALWGYFNEPEKNPIECDKPKFDMLLTKEIAPKHYGQLTRQERRAITPPGFAKAFYESNQ